jgi:hypothetical protein
MTATIDKLMINTGKPIMYDESLMNVLEDHMDFLRNHKTTTKLTVTPQQANVFQFDLQALLLELGVAADLHWVIMRMNGYDSFNQIDEDLMYLLAPDPTLVYNIASIQQSSLKKEAS